MNKTNTVRDIPGRPPLANTYWVIESRLLGGEHPAGATLGESARRLKCLKDAGIDSFVDLTEPGEYLEYRRLLLKRVEYRRSPIVDTGVPRTRAEMHDILSAIRASLEHGRKVYVHCRAGIGRTGLVLGCYLAEQCGNGEQALEELNRLWHQSERSAFWPRVPQTAEQTEYVLRWPALRHSEVDPSRRPR